MTTLSNLLKTRLEGNINNKVSDYKSTAYENLTEENIEDGELYVYSLTTSSPGTNCVCWIAPSSGTVVIEAWGPGGSTSKGGCCGTGIPGNPGAYVKKTTTVAAGDYICGNIGCSRPGTSLCCNSPGSATCIRIQSTDDGCMCLCAQGGNSGWWICGSGTSSYCCFRSAGFCGEFLSGSCGVICNTKCGQAQAYGGDQNHDGGYSSVFFYCCSNNYNPSCSQCYGIPYSPGLISTNGGTLYFRGTNCYTVYNQAVNSSPYYSAIRNVSNQDLGYVENYRCWAYREQVCCNSSSQYQVSAPASLPAISTATCCACSTYDRYCGWSYRGGHGMLKIKFIGS